ncbi:flavin-dependent monooxygenase [Salinactinospora qingdaonensis]|uniref:Flavin-dependent monooxygenase n=1 Tax=Salinactinospora qingdaonensis TaxID=702744 RepID=A0ABP7FCX1_9ACTN
MVEIGQRSAEIDEARRIPDDLFDSLVAAGYCRMLVPRRHGGPELGLPAALRVIEALARADGSVGWTVGQVQLAHLIFACLPETAQRTIYAHGPDTTGAGAVAPKGRATPQEDGHWRVTGQWPFITGCEASSWVYLNTMVFDGRSLRTTPEGQPETRMVVVPTKQMEILDTWSVMGLRGTGSHDGRLSGHSCAEDHTFTLRPGEPGSDRAIHRIAQSGLIIAASAIGIAQGALDEIVTLATGGKRPAFGSRRLAESPLFHDRLGEAAATVRAARALLHTESEAAWTVDGAEAAPLDHAALRASAARAVALAVTATDTAHNLGGGSAVYDHSPLQRRLRDIHTASQHFVAGRDMYAALGAVLAEVETKPGTP